MAAALVCAVAPFDAARVERLYSTGFYPALQQRVTAASNLVPFAVLDLLLTITLTALLIFSIRTTRAALRERSARRAIAGIWRLSAAAAVVYLTFLVLWGFNYRRTAMLDRLATTSMETTSERVSELGTTAVRNLNALHAQAHAIGWHGAEWRDASMRAAFADVQQRLADGAAAEPGRLKWTLLGPYFRWSSVDGMVNPFALEVLANPDLLPWERPFVAAHEWAHLAGYATESEASFVGWLTCLRAGVSAQYSAWLFTYWEVSGEVAADERERLAKMLAAGPRGDIAAIIDRIRRGQLPQLRNVSWAVYDQYLKANRVEGGVRSYGEVLTLILRARYEDGWTPVRRAASALTP